ncbi:MAG: type I restriction enzyme HsdR N-terminal domain-containing protein [Muribaculaceae bacterium]|nr:type I restriction enzyme HsdR N-terminal domain-containing protein [Muribaculaceae bacterium]
MPRSVLDTTPLCIPDDVIKMRQSVDGGHVEFYDPLRDKWVSATPEERVRQAFVAYMINNLTYWPSRMVNEYSLKLNGTLRRVDTVVFDDYMRPVMLVEYKAPDVGVTRRTFDQVVRYNMVLQARYLVVFNGLHIYGCEVDTDSGAYRFLEHIPTYKEIKG